MRKSVSRDMVAGPHDTNSILFWKMQRDARIALDTASPAILARFRDFNLPALRTLQLYSPNVARNYQQSFWVDAATYGLAYALDHWAWLVK